MSRATDRVAASQHRHYIESILQRCGADALQDPVRHSWLRCLNRYSLDPIQPRRPAVVEPLELRRRRERIGAGYAIVTAEMRRLAESLELPFGMAFTDTDGVILKYTGASGFADAARGAGFIDGAVWSEAEQGTNGMGTCLMVREPIIIEQHEHFLARNIGLTCYAAPLHDGRGQLFGVLDISCQLKQSHAPMLALLKLTAANIESRLLLAAAADALVVRFHRRHECLATAAEGIVVIDRAGVITGVNRNALRLLELSAHDELCGQPAHSWFQLDFAARTDHAHCVPLLSAAGTRIGFAQLQPHAQRLVHAAVPDTAVTLPDSLAAAERAALVHTLEQCDWNVSEAARRLRVGRKTLYRKLTKHSLQRN